MNWSMPTLQFHSAMLIQMVKRYAWNLVGMGAKRTLLPSNLTCLILPLIKWGESDSLSEVTPNLMGVRNPRFFYCRPSAICWARHKNEFHVSGAPHVRWFAPLFRWWGPWIKCLRRYSYDGRPFILAFKLKPKKGHNLAAHHFDETPLLWRHHGMLSIQSVPWSFPSNWDALNHNSMSDLVSGH